MKVPTVATLVAVVAAFTGCSDSTSPAASACNDAVTSLNPTITVGSSVTFDWAPACGVAFLLVEEDASDRWSLLMPTETYSTPATANRITPIITYGQTPAVTGVVAEPPEALIPGVTYDLVLWRMLPPGNDAPCLQRFGQYCLAAVKQFTR